MITVLPLSECRGAQGIDRLTALGYTVDRFDCTYFFIGRAKTFEDIFDDISVDSSPFRVHEGECLSIEFHLLSTESDVTSVRFAEVIIHGDTARNLRDTWVCM